METDNFYNSLDAMIKIESQKKEKYDEFKTKIESFSEISTLEEAKELALKLFPTGNELMNFNVGDAKCIILNTEDCFRIALDSFDEFICYDFA